MTHAIKQHCSDERYPKRADGKDDPRGGMLEVTERDRILIAPDHVTKRIRVEGVAHRSGKRIHRRGQKQNRRSVETDVGEDAYELAEIANPCAERCE